MVTLFNVLKDYQAVFHSGSTILPCLQQCLRVLVSLYPHQFLLLPVILMIAFLVSLKWYLIVNLLLPRPMAKAVEYLFIYLPAMYVFPLGNVYSDFFSPFKIGLGLYYWVVKVLHVLCIQVLYQICFVDISLILWVISIII